MKILARHKKWVEGATITESYDEGKELTRFTATIRGFRNWKIWQGNFDDNDKIVCFITEKVIKIKSRIDVGDESVFYEVNEYDGGK